MFIFFATLGVTLSLSHGAAPMATSFMSLNSLAERYGIPPAKETNQYSELKCNDSILQFHRGTRRLQFDGRTFWLNAPITKYKNAWSITNEDADSTIEALLDPASILNHRGYHLVVLDPGHGGDDPGAIGYRKATEKQIVLDIATRVKRKLIASNVAVRMTRSKDQTLALSQRALLATRWGGDAFVSIHANTAGSKTARGVETFTLPAAGFSSTTSNKPDCTSYTGNKYNAANTILAGFIQHGLLANTKTPDRGVKRSRFEVLRNAPCPAALVEVGFLSNKEEASLLLTPEYRDKVAEGIAQGILTYIVRTEVNQKH